MHFKTYRRQPTVGAPSGRRGAHLGSVRRVCPGILDIGVIILVMASTTEMLQTTLGETAYNALGILAANPTPMSGRMVAAALGVAPTTATAVLGKLREAGLAASSREGRADRWHLNTDNTVLRSWLEETQGEPSSAKTAGGMSPYATGGGGVTFERKVAVRYLALLLVGDGAVELGDGRFVVSVAFQQAPEHSVDDLVIRAARGDELEPSLVLAVGVRRSPDIVQSDESTKKLIRAFVNEVINAPLDGPERSCRARRRRCASSRRTTRVARRSRLQTDGAAEIFRPRSQAEQVFRRYPGASDSNRSARQACTYRPW